MKILMILLLSFLLLAEFMLGFFIIKSENAFNNRSIIIDAIINYHVWCIRNNKEYTVDYSDMENYENTLKRLSDWGYKNILPKSKYRVIKPFIEKVINEK